MMSGFGSCCDSEQQAAEREAAQLETQLVQIQAQKAAAMQRALRAAECMWKAAAVRRREIRETPRHR